MLDMLLGQLTLDVGRFRDVLKVEAEAQAPRRAEPPRSGARRRAVGARRRPAVP
jgi:hypothetical protein